MEIPKDIRERCVQGAIEKAAALRQKALSLPPGERHLLQLQAQRILFSALKYTKSK